MKRLVNWQHKTFHSTLWCCCHPAIIIKSAFEKARGDNKCQLLAAVLEPEWFIVFGFWTLDGGAACATLSRGAKNGSHLILAWWDGLARLRQKSRSRTASQFANRTKGAAELRKVATKSDFVSALAFEAGAWANFRNWFSAAASFSGALLHWWKHF